MVELTHQYREQILENYTSSILTTGYRPLVPDYVSIAFIQNTKTSLFNTPNGIDKKLTPAVSIFNENLGTIINN